MIPVASAESKKTEQAQQENKLNFEVKIIETLEKDTQTESEPVPEKKIEDKPIIEDKKEEKPSADVKIIQPVKLEQQKMEPTEINDLFEQVK